MNSSKPAPVNTQVPHPDMSLVRKYRIEKLNYLLDKAVKEDNYGLIKKFTKEIEIQSCYAQVGQ